MSAGGIRLIGGLAGLALIGAMTALSLGSDDQGSSPAQPIDFMHRVHARERGIACAYCHRTATTADYAGMPSTKQCMMCHRVVIPDYPEVWKLRSYWELNEPIPWKRVNRLPGHVYFSHKAHAAAGMPCKDCHGDVGGMDQVMQTAPLTMDWCLQCHRKRHASTECSACHR
jgi:hypothetical protein